MVFVKLSSACKALCKKAFGDTFFSYSRLVLLGLSLTRVVTYLFLLLLLNGFLFTIPGTSIVIGITAPIFFASGALVAVVVALFSKRIGSFNNRIVSLLVLISGISGALMMILYQQGFGLVMELISAALIGVMTALMIISWGEIYTKLEIAQIGQWIVLSFALSFALSLLLKSIAAWLLYPILL
ncbi:MAG: hypothetical protein LBH56_03695, partial [Coriobacteriales bacterium]|nr:hypothetical protein [Coriobacteriales bacterium]